MEETNFERIEEMVSRIVDAKNVQFRQEINEDFQSKIQLLAEGHQMLSEKLDRVEEGLEKKIDAVAVDLAAHRADTEGHKRGYMVKED